MLETGLPFIQHDKPMSLMLRTPVDFNDLLPMQIKAGKFDINKALSLLRLYNLLPDQMDLKLVGSILIQALLRLPEPDFNLAMLLIPERMQVSRCLCSRLYQHSITRSFMPANENLV